MSQETLEMSNDAWFAQRAWSVSANKVLPGPDGSSTHVTSLAEQICRPRSAEEIAELVKSLPPGTPISCVCGGHESSGVALIADHGAVIFDLVELNGIAFEESGGERFVTVGSGVVFRELVEAVHQQDGALPVGTGPGVGVIGYTLNGGLSGYFSRRLGLLGQRAVRMTVVMADGTLRTLKPEDELFTLMLGAGSALAIVVDMTFRLADARAIQGAEQLVLGFESREQAVAFSRAAMQFMKEAVIPNESVSVELVVTGTNALVVTTVFYDSFTGDVDLFTEPLRALAVSSRLPTLADTRWNSWYETAAALWPVIAEQKGSPLATSCHCAGTTTSPTDEVLDFVADVLIAGAPLDEAKMSIIEIRTLGGAVQTGRRIPTGNCKHTFFVDLITLYDSSLKTPAERQAIADVTDRWVDHARAVPELGVDFSGTHSQSDDVGRSSVAAEIFGSSTMARAVSKAKAQVDPENRLRFHPFARFLT